MKKLRSFCWEKNTWMTIGIQEVAIDVCLFNEGIYFVVLNSRKRTSKAVKFIKQ